MTVDSVHLQDFPRLNFNIDDKIVTEIDTIRDICNCVLSLRKEANIRVRMPLKKITICYQKGQFEFSNEHLNIIRQEVNAHEIELFTDNIDEIASINVVLDMRECGRLFGPKLKCILEAQKNNDFIISDGNLEIAGVKIDKALFGIEYKTKDGTRAMRCNSHNILVMIDTSQDHEIIIEGLARDIIRIVQQSRKNAKLEISDKIDVILYTDDKIFAEVEQNHELFIKRQILARSLKIKNHLLNDNTDSLNHMMINGNACVIHQSANEIDGHKFILSLRKA